MFFGWIEVEGRWSMVNGQWLVYWWLLLKVLEMPKILIQEVIESEEKNFGVKTYYSGFNSSEDWWRSELFVLSNLIVVYATWFLTKLNNNFHVTSKNSTLSQKSISLSLYVRVAFQVLLSTNRITVNRNKQIH